MEKIIVRTKLGHFNGLAGYIQEYIDPDNVFLNYGTAEDLMAALAHAESYAENNDDEYLESHTDEHEVTLDDCRRYLDNIRQEALETQRKREVLAEIQTRPATDDDIAYYENCGYLTVNTCRNGETVVWYLDNETELAVEVVSGRRLTDEEIAKELE